MLDLSLESVLPRIVGFGRQPRGTASLVRRVRCRQ